MLATISVISTASLAAVPLSGAPEMLLESQEGTGNRTSTCLAADMIAQALRPGNHLGEIQ